MAGFFPFFGFFHSKVESEAKCPGVVKLFAKQGSKPGFWTPSDRKSFTTHKKSLSTIPFSLRFWEVGICVCALFNSVRREASSSNRVRVRFSTFVTCVGAKISEVLKHVYKTRKKVKKGPFWPGEFGIYVKKCFKIFTE